MRRWWPGFPGAPDAGFIVAVDVLVDKRQPQNEAANRGYEAVTIRSSVCRPGDTKFSPIKAVFLLDLKFQWT
jgi:hypothetical protein